VVVAGRAGEGKVVGHQGLELTLVLFHPRLIPSQNWVLQNSPGRFLPGGLSLSTMTMTGGKT
jgi:hypothetical protein